MSDQRNSFFDNAKGLLIILVVFGHLIESVIDTHTSIKAVYLTLYAFHMPAFALISGIFSKSDVSISWPKNIIQSILIPFITFEIIFEIYSLITIGHLSHYTLGIQPYWILWYLWSLFIWKLLSPFFLLFRYPITLSVAIALGAGYIDSFDYFLGLSRTIVFFPFFLIGLQAKTHFEHFGSYPHARMRLVAGLIFIAAIFVFYKMSAMRVGWFYGSYPYDFFGLTDWRAAAYRLSTYLFSITLVFAFLSIVPTQKSFLTRLGINTISIYLWHGLIIKILNQTSIAQTLVEKGAFSYLLLTLTSAIVLAYVLGLDSVTRLTQLYLFKPIERMCCANRLDKTH